MPEFEFRHDWTMLYQRQNWYDFTFVHVMVENDVNLGQFEICAAILGLHLRVVWDTGETPARRRLVSERDRFLADFNTDE